MTMSLSPHLFSLLILQITLELLNSILLQKKIVVVAVNVPSTYSYPHTLIVNFYKLPLKLFNI